MEISFGAEVYCLVDGTHGYWGNFGAGDVSVYWLAYGRRAVRRVAKEGGAPTELAPCGRS
jgi:hypothetical protein